MPTAFDFGLGTSQGRITDPDAPGGSYVFELGHVGGRTKANIAVGDYSRVSQSITVVSNDLLARVTVLLTEPDEASTNVAWELRGRLNGGIFFRRLLTAQGRTIELTDLAISLAGGGSPSTIAFSLEALTP
jgi:hypothetical protein